MSAENNEFPWLSYYKNYNFFEQRMREHSKVVSCENINTGLYSIRLKNGRALKVFICECYAFGMAEYIESSENYGELNAVVISSNWCGYSLDIKRDCMEKNVGIFDIRGFMAAINRDNFWTYMTEDEKEQFKKYGWL